MQRAFNEYDKSGDGTLDKDEFVDAWMKLLKKHKNIDPIFVEAIFEKLDVDGSGSVEFQEFKRARKELSKAIREMPDVDEEDREKAHQLADEFVHQMEESEKEETTFFPPGIPPPPSPSTSVSNNAMGRAPLEIHGDRSANYGEYDTRGYKQRSRQSSPVSTRPPSAYNQYERHGNRQRHEDFLDPFFHYSPVENYSQELIAGKKRTPIRKNGHGQGAEDSMLRDESQKAHPNTSHPGESVVE